MRRAVVPVERVAPDRRLFIDYIRSFDKLRGFFARDPHDPDVFRRVALERSGLPCDRGRIVERLRSHAIRTSAPGAVLANVESLLDPNTLTIIAGQQPGVLTGPLYTVLKAAAAIRLAAELNARNDGCAFVPVFWNGSDDHDLAEMDHIYAQDLTGDLRNCAPHWPPRAPLPATSRPVNHAWPW